MGTKTISLADDAYEKLRAHKREGESFSDVVRRLAGGVTLSEYHGVIEEDTADELEAILTGRRDSRSENHRERVDALADELDG
ncbi:MAG: antitoxin VapB family protein [Natronomonas sp.]